MLRQDLFCEQINVLVQKYYFVMKSTFGYIGGKVGIIYNKILDYVKSHSITVKLCSILKTELGFFFLDIKTSAK